MAILLLAERGQLSLDDGVRKYVAELPEYANGITIRHLLTHTSGLREGHELQRPQRLVRHRPGDQRRRGEILARQRSLNSTPGAEYQYSNAGYVLLGTIVSRVSGQSLPAFAAAHIFQPLGMTKTHIHDVKGDATTIVPLLGYLRRRPRGRQRLSLERDAGGGSSRISARRTPWRPEFSAQSGTAGSTRRWRPAAMGEELQRGPCRYAGSRCAMETPATLTGGASASYGFGLVIERRRGLREIGARPGAAPGSIRG